MTDLTPEKIEALREMEGRVPQGEWAVDWHSFDVIVPGLTRAQGFRVAAVPLGYRTSKAARDLQGLIAASRNALPALLSAASDLDEALRLLRRIEGHGFERDSMLHSEVRTFLARHSGGTA